MLNRKIDLIIGGLFILALALGVSAQSASTATVSATVTVQNVSVAVSDGTVAYGTLAAGAVTNTLSGGLNDQQSATNDGNVTENFNIKGSNSANWTIVSATGTNDQYAHKFSTSSSFVGTGGVLLSTSYATLTTTVATNATRTFHLEIHAPSGSTVYTSQSVDVTVQAVAQ